MKEEELLKKRLMELCEKAYNQNIYTYTHFLNEYEQSIYQDMKQELAYAHPILVGGHKHFTRAVVMFGSEELFGYQGEVPVVCARISPVFDKFAEELSHRDYLGALMNLGIERHLIGDILIDGRYAYIFCMEHIIGVIKEQLDQVRHTAGFCGRSFMGRDRICPKIQEKRRICCVHEAGCSGFTGFFFIQEYQ